MLASTKRLLVLAFALALLVAGPAVAAEKDVVDVAVGNEDFETLVTALKAAGLVDTLKGDGPFTIFAPTDAAFEALPEGTLESLLADKEKLTAVLTYHVVPGKMMASDVVGESTLTTVQGGTLSVDASNGVQVGGATVVATDVVGSNGVIHVIDSVHIPSE